MLENEDDAVDQGNDFVETRENKETLILSDEIRAVISTWFYRVAVNRAISPFCS